MHPKTDAHIRVCAICSKRAADAVVTIFNESKGKPKPWTGVDSSLDQIGKVTETEVTEAVKIFKHNMREHGKAK